MQWTRKRGFQCNGFVMNQGFRCSVWSVIKGGNVGGFKSVKPGRARVSRGLIASRPRLALARFNKPRP